MRICFLLCYDTKRTQAHRLYKIHWFKKKKKKMQHVEQNNFFPLLIKWATGVERRSVGRIQVKKSNLIIPQAHARSNLQHKFQSLCQRHNDKSFLNLLRHISCLAGHLRPLWLLGFGESLGCSFESVLKGVAPADSELTCSTEQCCT